MVVRGYAGYPESTAVHGNFVLPATAAVLVVLKMVDSSGRPPEFLSGPHVSRVRVDGACSPSYLELWLDPLGAYTLLGVSGAEVGGHLVDLSDVIGRRSRDLADRIRDEPTWQRRFGILDDFLLRNSETGPRPDPRVRRAWECLVETGGAMPIGHIAADVGWSHKHLITRFTQHLGLAPKTAARLVRFDRVRARVDVNPGASWGDVAADCGYADQAHLTRDFREFSGVTPTEYAAARR
ncbi:hypothetical protein CC117_29015 [Parafrankia colletiae]|uniref:HTH araC/xylS-type domain-containing protein n=1 Tax=Parafrankia colletiae TaxID=573497 RepID=A0A1S1Q8T0_9ACTN|nr:helix-turn-helix domain-containing protein [Parafrankia colletiae]OHV29605.1 hypothetical protein CC117_29015 [Parafrankia colletiae]